MSDLFKELRQAVTLKNGTKLIFMLVCWFGQSDPIFNIPISIGTMVINM